MSPVGGAAAGRPSALPFAVECRCGGGALRPSPIRPFVDASRKQKKVCGRHAQLRVLASEREQDLEEEGDAFAPLRNIFGRASKTISSRGKQAAGSLPPLQGKGTKRLALPKLAPPSKGTQRLALPKLAPPSKGTRQLRAGGSTQRLQGAPEKRGGGLFGGLPALGTGRAGGRPRPRDPNTVFVAGGTGRLGARIVRTLLAASPQLRLRAGVRDVTKAKGFLDTAVSYGLLPPDAARRVALVEADLTDPASIGPAIGNASKVVQAIGALESALDFSQPKKIDGDAAVALVEAAAAAGVQQYVMVSSLGTGKFGLPAGVLNLFGGVLNQKRRAEKVLEDSGIAYTIVRPGGMERPTDAYKATHNVRIAPRDSLFGGQVSRLQVAELIAAAVASPELAENKVLEVVAEETAPALGYEELLKDAACEISQAERAAAAKEAAAAKRRAEEARAEACPHLRALTVETAQSAADEAAEEAAESAAVAREARAELAAAQRNVGPVLAAAQQAEARLEQLRAALQEGQRQEAAARAVLAAATQAARSAQGLSAAQRAAVARPILFPEEYAREQEQARKQAEEQARREADAQAKAQAKAKTDEEAAQAKAKKEQEAAQAKARKEEEAAQAKAKKEAAEAKAKKEQEAAQAKAKKEKDAAQARAKKEAEAQVKKEADAADAQKSRSASAKPASTPSTPAMPPKAAPTRQPALAKQAKPAAGNAAAADAARAAAGTAAPGSVGAAADEAAVQVKAAADTAAAKVSTVAEQAKAQVAGAAPEPVELFKDASTWFSGLKAKFQPGTEAGAAASNANGAKPAAQPVAAAAAQQEAAGNKRAAQEWIRAWRAKSLEAKLPAGVKAGSKK